MMICSKLSTTPALDKNGLRAPPPRIKASLTTPSLALSSASTFADGHAVACHAQQAKAIIAYYGLSTTSTATTAGAACGGAAGGARRAGMIPSCTSMPALMHGMKHLGTESPILPWASPVQRPAPPPAAASIASFPPALSLGSAAEAVAEAGQVAKVPAAAAAESCAGGERAEDASSRALTPPPTSPSSSSLASSDAADVEQPKSDDNVSESSESAVASPAPCASWLRELFAACLETSAAAEPGSAGQLIAYDASDCPTTKLAGPFKCRLDARRNKKPNPQAAALAADPTVDPNAHVDVTAPVDAAKFNFTKVNPLEVLASVHLAGERYSLLPNKFPVADTHMLLVAGTLEAQRLSAPSIEAIAELLARCDGFAASFNSWGAAASINHLHIHLTDESLPLERFEVVHSDADDTTAAVHLLGYPAAHAGFCYRTAAGRRALLGAIDECHEARTPYNVTFTTKGYAFVFARTRTQAEHSWRTYGERLGGFEMAGIFTAYQQETYCALDEASIKTMLGAAVVQPPVAHAADA